MFCVHSMIRVRWVNPHFVFGELLSYDAIEGLRVAQDLMTSHEAHHTGPGGFPISNLLWKNGCRNVTCPQDRIYALIGLTASQIHGEPLPAGLKPDYSKSVQDVYRDASRHVIDESRSLSIMARIVHLGDGDLKLDGYPSWVPRWDLQAHEDYCSPLGWWHRAHGDNRPEKHMPQGADPNVLSWPGLQLDRVAETSPVLTRELLRDKRRLAEAVRKIKTMYKRSKKRAFASGLGVFNGPYALADTLIAGRSGMSDATDEEIHRFFSFRDQLLASASQPSPVRSAASTGADDVTGSFDEDARSYYELMLGMCTLRRFFITHRGYIGLTPPAGRSGDVVAVLHNGDLAYLLRPLKDDHHQMVGPAYVHGIMNGAAMHWHLKKGRADKIFHMR